MWTYVYSILWQNVQEYMYKVLSESAMFVDVVTNILVLFFPVPSSNCHSLTNHEHKVHKFSANTLFRWGIPSPPLDNGVCRLRGNISIIRTAMFWILWHNVHSQQHTYMSSSYRSNRLALLHWDPYTVRRGGCIELYYCNMVECFWLDSSLIFDDQLVSFNALTLLVWSYGL